MTDKQLRSLSKKQLFQLLHQQEVEIERLTNENTRLTEQKLNLEQAGSIAEASISVSGIIQAAQSAADVYLDSIRKVEADKLESIARYEEEAKARALSATEARTAESRAQLERLIVEMLRIFDSQVTSLGDVRGELSELINRNDLQHLLPENVPKSTV